MWGGYAATQYQHGAMRNPDLCATTPRACRDSPSQPYVGDSTLECWLVVSMKEYTQRTREPANKGVCKLKFVTRHRLACAFLRGK